MGWGRTWVRQEDAEEFFRGLLARVTDDHQVREEETWLIVLCLS